MFISSLTPGFKFSSGAGDGPQFLILSPRKMKRRKRKLTEAEDPVAPLCLRSLCLIFLCLDWDYLSMKTQLLSQIRLEVEFEIGGLKSWTQNLSHVTDMIRVFLMCHVPHTLTRWNSDNYPGQMDVIAPIIDIIIEQPRGQRAKVNFA